MEKINLTYIMAVLILTGLIFIPILYTHAGNNGNAITGFATENNANEEHDIVGEPQGCDPSSLTNFQKNKIKTTKENLDKLNSNMIDDIKAEADKKGVPEAIVLALITQESTGNNYEKKPSTNNAVGIFQVEPHQHTDTIKNECGDEYLSECNGKYESCMFNKFHSDLTCQIKVATELMNENYKASSKPKIFQCPQNCGESCAKKVTYSGWEEALRRYNGWGCNKLTYNYVEDVVAYATGWGGGCYSSDALVSQNAQVSSGIIGQHSFRPSFTLKEDYNLNAYQDVYTFAKNAAQRCQGYNGDSGKECLQNYIAEFNTENQKQYTSSYSVTITMNERECEDSSNIPLYDFVSSIEDCAASTDNNCQCKLYRTTFGYKVNIKSNDYGTIFTHNDAVSQSNNNLIEKVHENLNDELMQNINSEKSIYQQYYVNKDANGLRLTPTNPNTKECTIIPNKYRMCAVTSDKTPKIENGKTVFEPVKIKFAILLKETVFPPPITNLEIRQKEYSDKDIIVTWDKSPADDVAKYEIYYSSNIQDLKQDIKTVRTVPGKIDIPADNYDTAFDDVIPPQEPICELNGNICTFKFKDNSGKTGELKSNNLYYLKKSNKFVYIITGVKKGLAESEYNIGMTAVDKSDNELDNIIQVMPIKQITPKDLLPPALITAVTKTYIAGILTMMWTAPAKNLDGSDTNVNVQSYEIYDLSSSPVQGIADISTYTATDTTSLTQYIKQATPGQIIKIAIVPLDDNYVPNKFLKKVYVNSVQALP